MRFFAMFLAIIAAAVSPMMGEDLSKDAQIVTEGTVNTLTVNVSEPTRINVGFNCREFMLLDCGRDMMVVVSDDGIRTTKFENPQTVWGECIVVIRTTKMVNVSVQRLEPNSSSPNGWSVKREEPLFEKTFVGGREAVQSEGREALRAYIEADSRVAAAYERLAAADKILEGAELKTYEALRGLNGNKDTIERLKEERKAVEGVRTALNELSRAQEASTSAAERTWAAAGKK